MVEALLPYFYPEMVPPLVLSFLKSYFLIAAAEKYEVSAAEDTERRADS